MKTVIEPGNRSKQGNAICPQCGETVLIKNQWRDPLKCSKCDVPYVPKLPKPNYH